MTTYVLGAGASLHAGYPLGNDLGRKLHDWALRNKQQDDLRFHVETSLGREWEEFWNYVWAQASHALRSSSKVVLIGYSMPEADKRARDILLLQTNKRAEISLYCGGRGRALEGEFKSHGFTLVENPQSAYFEDFIRT